MEKQAELSPERQRLLAIRLKGSAREPSVAQRIHKRPPGPRAPLSFAQHQMWVIDQMTPGNPAYNIPVAYRLSGEINAGALEESFNAIIKRHEAWRTTFHVFENDCIQEVHSECRISMNLMALDGLPVAEREAAARAFCASEAVKPFDLCSLPLVRVCLIKLDQDEHVLLINIHHIVADGLSLNVIFNELDAIYRALTAGTPARLPELTIQYADFAVWQRENISKERQSSQLEFWKQQLAGNLPVLEIATDKPRPRQQSFSGSSIDFPVPEDVVKGLTSIAKSENCTFFAAILAAFQVILLTYSNGDEIIIGSPVANRPFPETDRLIGNFLNIVALRGDLAGGPTFIELLRRTGETTLNALSNKDLPFEMLVGSLKPHRDPSRSPVFQAMMQILPAVSARIGELTVARFSFEVRFAQVDVTLHLFEESHGGFLGHIQYCTDLFAPAMIERMARNFVTLLESIVANPHRAVHELPLLGEAEERRILVEWNDTRVDYPGSACLHEYIEEQVERTPDAPAVAFGEEVLTYRELNQRANDLAHTLQSLGVRPDSLVAICAERSAEMVVGLLAILKAGGAYVPLDPGYPRERIAFMLTDAAPRVLLTQRRLLARLPEHAAQVICLDDPPDASGENPGSGIEPDHLAYVIYTSGSTGKPKGAMNTHRGICNRLQWMQAEYQLTRDDAILQKTPFTFDVSVWEFFWPLMTGARLVVAKPDLHGDSAYLVSAIRAEKITTLHFVPSMLSAFLTDKDAARCTNLKRVICSGEALPHEIQERFFSVLPGVELHNLYGPTEAAVDVTFWKCDPESDERVVPIGRPVANTCIYLLNDGMKPVPAGCAGELHIGGVQLARGYLARPDLTAEKFVSNPFGEGRLYKTGDLARYREDGAIEYLGRIDHQVKIRGFRIELGEIEAVLRQQPGVLDCAVIAREDSPGDKRLTAYVVPEKELGVDAKTTLPGGLKEKLPGYMVPSAFITLATLPKLPNGKLDRRSLPAPDRSSHPADAGCVEPRTPLERKLAEIWQGILGIERAGVHDNFFDLGGDSLLGLRVVNQLRELVSGRIALGIIFEAPTIAALAERLEKAYPRKLAAFWRPQREWMRRAVALLPRRPGGCPRSRQFRGIRGG